MTENQRNEIELEEIPLNTSNEIIVSSENLDNKKSNNNMKKYLFIGLSIIGLIASAIIIGISL